MSKLAPNIYRPTLAEPGTSNAVPDLADRLTLAGALFFGTIWFVPTKWWVLRAHFEGGDSSMAIHLFTLFMIVLVIASVWFFLTHLACGMAGGGRRSIRIALAATVLPATAVILKLVMLYVSET